MMILLFILASRKICFDVVVVDDDIVVHPGIQESLFVVVITVAVGCWLLLLLLLLLLFSLLSSCSARGCCCCPCCCCCCCFGRCDLSDSPRLKAPDADEAATMRYVSLGVHQNCSLVSTGCIVQSAYPLLVNG